MPPAGRTRRQSPRRRSRTAAAGRASSRSVASSSPFDGAGGAAPMSRTRTSRLKRGERAQRRAPRDGRDRGGEHDRRREREHDENGLDLAERLRRESPPEEARDRPDLERDDAGDERETAHHVDDAAEAGRDLRRVRAVEARIGGAEREPEADDRRDHAYERRPEDGGEDRKSTRLNSSH